MTHAQKKTIRNYKKRTWYDRWFHQAFERAWATEMKSRGVI